MCRRFGFEIICLDVEIAEVAWKDSRPGTSGIRKVRWNILEVEYDPLAISRAKLISLAVF